MKKNNSVPGEIPCIYKSILSPNVLDLKSPLCERQYKKNSVTHGGSIILISAANNTGYENLNADSDQDHATYSLRVEPSRVEKLKKCKRRHEKPQKT